MERSKDWMDEAKGDLERAKSDRDGGYHNWACFSAQQAAEKAVKVVFQTMGAGAWGYSVVDLLKELSKEYRVSEEIMNRAKEEGHMPLSKKLLMYLVLSPMFIHERNTTG